MRGLKVAGTVQLQFYWSPVCVYPFGNGNSHYAVLETYIFNIQSSVGSFTGFVVCYCCVYE